MTSAPLRRGAHYPETFKLRWCVRLSNKDHTTTPHHTTPSIAQSPGKAPKMDSSPIVLTHKAGDTFELIVEIVEDDLPVDVRGWSVRAQIRRGSLLVQSLAAVFTDPIQGICSVTATAAETRTWPQKRLFLDVELLMDVDKVVSSKTITVNLVRDITR